MGARSREAGKRGERAACHFLQSIGINAHRGQQHSGSDESPDVVLPNLPGVYLEVKYAGAIGLGTQALEDAVEQATEDAAGTAEPMVLWRPKGTSTWRLTFRARDPQVLVTTTGADRIWEVLTSFEG